MGRSLASIQTQHRAGRENTIGRPLFYFRLDPTDRPLANWNGRGEISLSDPFVDRGFGQPRHGLNFWKTEKGYVVHAGGRFARASEAELSVSCTPRFG